MLGAFEGSESRLNLTQLAAHAQVPLPTAHRIVTDLVEFGALRRDDNGQYRVGRRIWKIAQNAGKPYQLTVRPQLADLFRQTGQTCHVAIRDGGNALIIDRVYGPGQEQRATRVGDRLPLHASAVGKVLLAYEESWIRDGYLRQALIASTPATVVDPVRLDRELAVIREEGFATSIAESRPGASSIAVPVLVDDDHAVAAVGLVTPTAAARSLTQHLAAVQSVAREMRAEASRWPWARDLLRSSEDDD